MFFASLFKKVAIPDKKNVRVLAWNPEHGWLCAGGDDSSLRVLTLEPEVNEAATNVRGLTPATAPLAADTVGGTDQSYLSYSFDIETNGAILHFAVINTDPTGNDGHAPTNWLTSDFSAAAARGLSAMKPVKYFVFGHKMAFTYNYQASGAIEAGGLDTDTTSRNNFWRFYNYV